MLDYKIMYVSRTGNTQRLAVCIYQSLQQLGNGDIEEINCNTEPGKSHLLYVGFCVEKGDCPIEVLELLMLNPDKVYSRENLLKLVWGTDYPGDVRTVDVHIRRLREKIESNPSEPRYVHTKWGVGYYFNNK